MAGIFNSISQLLTGSSATNPGNAQAQNNLGVAEQARNDASSRLNTTGQNILQAFQQYAGQPNPALSGAYAPVMQNPAASSTVSAPTVGSVYSGFNPGAVPPVGGGGATTPSAAPTYASVLNGAVPTAATAAKAGSATGATATPGATSATSATSGLPAGYNWKPLPNGSGYIATDPSNSQYQITDVTKAGSPGGTGFDFSDPYTGQYDSGMKTWAPTIAAAMQDFSNINGPIGSGATASAGGGSRSSKAA